MSLASKFQDLDRYLTDEVKPTDEYPQDADEAIGKSFVLSNQEITFYGYFDEADMFGYRVTEMDKHNEAYNRLLTVEGKLMLEAICTEINTQLQEMEK